MTSKWLRYRFQANGDDWRPVKWPPLGPCWCTGYGYGPEDENGDETEYAIVVAYLPPDGVLTDYWPEAAEVDVEECDSITFTGRFPKPDWWQGE